MWWSSDEMVTVFSVSWFFRDHFNMLIWCSRNIQYIIIVNVTNIKLNLVLLNIFVEPVILFSGVFDEQSKKKNIVHSIYLFIVFIIYF